jgi:hypothetical protein
MILTGCFKQLLQLGMIPTGDKRLKLLLQMQSILTGVTCLKQLL